MKITVSYPEKNYPYLAVWVGKGDSLDCDVTDIKAEDIVLISLISEKGNDKKAYVQRLLGGRSGYFVSTEDDFYELPRGYSITLCQFG